MSIFPTQKLTFLEAREPHFRLQTWSNVINTLYIRGYTKHGTFNAVHTTSSDRAMRTTEIRLPDFPIAITIDEPAGGVRRGQIWCRGSLLLGGFPVYQYFAQYLTDENHPFWPPGLFEDNLAPPGFLRRETVSPTAGSEISFSVPTNARWRIHSLRYKFVTDATITTRRINIIVDDGVNTLIWLPCKVTQAESLIRYYNFVPGDIDETAFTNTEIRASLPNPLILFQGWRIRTSTTNLQAGDAFSGVNLVIEEWLED